MKLEGRLRTRVSKLQMEKRMIVVYDNARIHKTKAVVKTIKRLRLKVFSIPPYSPEMNTIEHSFGLLKMNLSKRNFNAKSFISLIINEVKKLPNTKT